MTTHPIHRRGGYRRRRPYWLNILGATILGVSIVVFIHESSFASSLTVTAIRSIRDGKNSQTNRKHLLKDLPGVSIKEIFLYGKDIDKPEKSFQTPDHVLEFEAKGIKLPKYDPKELFIVSITSNNTYERAIAQSNTFGRILDINFQSYKHDDLCIICDKETFNELYHCPTFRYPCTEHVFFDKNPSWWCATRQEILALHNALKEWKEDELPKWVHLMEDGTFVNPINEMLFIKNQNYTVPVFLGDDWGNFLAGGCGRLMSQGLIKLLLGPPVVPIVTRRWSNGTDTVVANTQLESCVYRYLGGDWCYFHGDWALSECVKEVGVQATDVSGNNHLGLFSQLHTSDMYQKTHPWFGTVTSWLADGIHNANTAAIHTDAKVMYGIFYTVIVPFYQGVLENLERATIVEA